MITSNSGEPLSVTSEDWSPPLIEVKVGKTKCLQSNAINKPRRIKPQTRENETKAIFVDFAQGVVGAGLRENNRPKAGDRFAHQSQPPMISGATLHQSRNIRALI